MNNTKKLEAIMCLLDTEMYEIDRAVARKESYESLTGQTVSSVDAALTFTPIYEKCEEIYKTPDHDLTNLTNEHSMSFR
jgi:hypothetical protein